MDVKTFKDRDRKRFERIKVLFLDLHDELTGLHINPSIRAIRAAFPFPVAPPVLCEVRRELIASGEIPAKGVHAAGLAPPDPGSPVVDDPQEVARLAPRIAEGYAAGARARADAYHAPAKVSVPRGRVPRWLDWCGDWLDRWEE